MTAAPLVAQILYSGLGGHGGVVFAMLAADKGRRWRHALGFLGIEPLLPAYREQCAREGATYDYIPAIAGRPWRYYRGVYRWLSRTRPDAVVLHTPPALLPCLLYARTRGVPLVVVEHQNNELKTQQDWLFSRLSMRWADRLVVLTPRYEEELRAALGTAFDPAKVRLIGNGIDTDRFAPAASRPPPAAVRVGMAARFTVTKRFDLMVDLLARLRQRAPERDWQVTLAGSGEKWAMVRAKAVDADLDVSFEGLLSGEALADWYRGLDIYCHATEGETLSVSVLQAMASGVPVIGSDVEGVSNLLGGEPPAGRLVREQTADAFADAVLELATDPTAADALATIARQVAVAHYGQAAMFDAYAGLVARVLEERRRS